MSKRVTRLRSNFPEGTTRWAVRRAEWKSIGVSDEDFEKPKIAVVNSSSELGACYAHLDEIAKVVKRGIADAGGIGFEIRTIAPMDFGTGFGHNGRYLLPSRDLLVNDVEVMVNGAQLDGMVLLSSCDKTVPGHLMAAGRLDIPSIVVACGYQVPAGRQARKMDIEDVYEQVGALATGRMTIEELRGICDAAIEGPGVCAGLGTANTMQMLSEALGMSLPGSTPVWAAGEKLRTISYRAGKQIVELIRKAITPRKILSRAAYENAVIVDLAAGGSLNSIRHLAGIAAEAEQDVDIVKIFEKYQDTIPLLTRTRPNGPHRIEELERAGGTLCIMKGLANKLHLYANTVSGGTVGDNIVSADFEPNGVIGTYEHPVSPHGGIRILRGKLAPEGALVKISAVPEHMRRFRGRARVFEAEERAMEALGRGRIRKGSVIVLRHLGPKGGPGTVFAANLIAALSGAGLAEEVAVVTDGEISGLNRGLVVGQVMPEAAENGPLALVRTNDVVTIDVDSGEIDLGVGRDELKKRERRYRDGRGWMVGRSWLNVYGRLAGRYSGGAVLDATRPRSAPP